MKKVVNENLSVENEVGGGGHFYLVDENDALTEKNKIARKRFLVFFVNRQAVGRTKEETR